MKKAAIALGLTLLAHASLAADSGGGLRQFLAARAAHDILNPVSATQMALTLAVRRGVQDARTEELLERAEDLARVTCCLGKMTQLQQAVIRLSLVDERPREEVGALLGISAPESM